MAESKNAQIMAKALSALDEQIIKTEQKCADAWAEQLKATNPLVYGLSALVQQYEAELKKLLRMKRDIQRRLSAMGVPG